MTYQFKIKYPPTKAGKLAWARDYSLNAYYAGKHWAKRKADADYWHMLTRSAIRAQLKNPKMLTGPAKVYFSWDDNLDVDNHAAMGKMIVDALKGVLIKDDTRRYLAGVSHGWNEEGIIIVTVEGD